MPLRMLAKLTLIITYIFITASGHASDSNSNTSIEFQSGGLKGAVHASLGYTFYDKHRLALGFGVTHSSKKQPGLSMFSLNYMFHGETEWLLPVFNKEFRLKPVNFGFSTLVAQHDSLFLKLPEALPDDYYAPTAVRILLEYQVDVQLDKNTDAYFKLTALDVGFANYVRNYSFYRDNYDWLGLEGILNWGVGIRRTF